MEELEEFPFVVGEKVEAKSNIKGYRGAWFRCEVKDIRSRKGEIWCSLQYLDFPDEKVSPTKAYQQDLAGKKRRVLMLRPSFPTVCQEFDGSAISSSVGAFVVSNGDCQVGDLVDWWSDGCYWGAKITAVANKDFVQVELPSAPIGEGGRYEAAVKDIRPSLEWSVEELWTVPCLKDYSNNERALGINQISAGFAGPIDQFETGKKEHVFIARQDPLRSPIVRGFRVSDEEVHLKRKAQVCEADLASDERNAIDVEQYSNSLKIAQMEHAIGQGLPPTAFPPPHLGAVKDTAAINHPKRLTRTLTSHVGDKTTLTRQVSRLQKTGTEVGTNSRGLFHLLNEPIGKDQLECLSTECAAEYLDFGFLEQDETGKDSEGKTHQIGQASGLKELEPLTLRFCQHGEEKQTCELCMLGWEEEMGTTTSSATRHLGANFYKGCNSLSICNRTAGAVSDQNVGSLVGEGKSVNVDELSVASAIMSLEELVSRVVWLKGVLQLGLKGWSQERNKRKWVLCERESSACENLSQDGKNGSIDQKSDKALLEGALRSSVEITNQEMCNPADSPRNITQI